MKEKNKNAQELGKLSAQKSPRSPEYYKKLSAAGVAARKKKVVEEIKSDGAKKL